MFQASSSSYLERIANNFTLKKSVKNWKRNLRNISHVQHQYSPQAASSEDCPDTFIFPSKRSAYYHLEYTRYGLRDLDLSVDAADTLDKPDFFDDHGDSACCTFDSKAGVRSKLPLENWVPACIPELRYLLGSLYHPWLLHVGHEWRSCNPYWVDSRNNQRGAPSNKSFYPIVHIYLSEICFLTDLDLIILHKLVPFVFGLLYILFMYIFAKALFSESAGALLTALISCSLWLGWYIDLVPNGLGNLFLPVALFLMVRYLQQKTWAWATAFAAVILLYPVFHPVPTIFLGMTFLTVWMPTILPDLINVLRKRKVGALGFNKLTFGLMLPFLLLLIWSIFWISSFPMWDGTISSMYLTICSEAESSHAMAFVDQAIYAGEHGFSIIEQVIKRFWGLIILSILSLAALPLLWRSFSHGRHDEYIFSLYGPFGVLGLVIPALFIFNLAFDPLRFTAYILLLGTVLAAYFLSYLLTDKSKEIKLHRPRLKTVFVILLIISLFITGLLNLYLSPYNLTQSRHTTQSEMMGMECFFKHRDATTPISGILVEPRRFADIFLSPEERNAQILLYNFKEIDSPPWHFGYDMHGSISSVYDEETDLIITQLARKNYEDYFPHLAPYRFNAQDFKRLNSDPGLNFLYTNGEFDVWKITVSTDPQ